MGRKWQKIGRRGAAIQTAEGESLRERMAFWAGVQVAVAAAIRALDIHRFARNTIREFVDDLDMMMDPLMQGKDQAAELLKSYGIQMSKQPDAPNQPRFDIRPDLSMCHSCGQHEEHGKMIFCKILQAQFRRGRGSCIWWRGSRAMPADWQRKMMQAGGPPQRNDLTDDQREWREMMDEIRTGETN